MNLFQDGDQAEKAKQRLQSLADMDLAAFWERSFQTCPDPDRALINLERWLSAVSNPRTQFAHLAESPRLANLLIDLLGASQTMSDALIQNPELASLVTDPSSIANLPTKEQILAEGVSLLKSASSFHHSLDRLRYLKQRWRIPIVVGDLAGAWPAEQVWRTISDLADAILELCLDVVWKEYSARKEVAGDCPVMVVAFGKLGGRELNYSSDVDLVYVLDDGADETLERHAARFCEMHSRALADTMGRGSLYRVDLRLRPFGSSGPVCPTMRAVEAYYRSHAETWEAQALIRSRPICGLPDYHKRWGELIERHCFKKQVSEFTLTSILVTRERIEDIGDKDDLKRGAGGIRDVEFLAQVLQMLHGGKRPSLRVQGTLDALRELGKSKLLADDSVIYLAEGYAFLRQMEHRCQLVNDRQTHSIPTSKEAREHLARLMGFAHWQLLETELSFQRQRVRAIYSSVLTGVGERATSRDTVLRSLNAPERPLIATWFDSLPESAEFYRSLAENEGSLARIRALAAAAPLVLRDLPEHLALTEEILSGEIEEAVELRLPTFDATDSRDFAHAAKGLWLREVVRWCLDPASNLGIGLSKLFDAVLKAVALALEADFDAIALGSYGLLEPSIESDLDLFLLVGDDLLQERAEEQAQRFLAAFSGMKRHGWRPELDLRLRPEGGQGLLARSHSGLKTYELERMEMWERFALGSARLVFGDSGSQALAIKVAYAQPLTPEGLRELVAMKKRIETERVQPPYYKRDVKIGFGGLSDIEWLVHLYEMRYPTTLEVGRHATITERLRRMAQAQLVNTVEVEQLLRARSHLLRTRAFLSLLGLVGGVVPENPDKLDRLAKAMRQANGYEFQKEHQSVIEGVRAIYTEGLERLGV